MSSSFEFERIQSENCKCSDEVEVKSNVISLYKSGDTALILKRYRRKLVGQSY
jgi:hypothetical protein